ncbi:MAG: 2-oxo acid dehydrogenase subunit E2 [Nocardioidaceae bacterium]|nr:2-oxo acid dehydrogenase subunit E2 [Nocardioidaceae bacterium]
MTTHEFKLPDVGEGLTEAELVTWMVKVGDTIKINDVIVEIETAKSLVELPSPFAGVVSELLVAEGATVDVGAPIIAVETAEASPTAPETDPPTEAGSPAEDLVPTPKEDAAIEPGLIGGPAPGGRTSVLVGYGPRTTEAKRRPRVGATPSEVSPAAAQAGVQHAFTPHATEPPTVDIADAEPAAPAEQVTSLQQPAPRHSPQQLAKPPVRKLAKDLGVDLSQVSATGLDGTITREDVENAAGRRPLLEGGPLEEAAQPSWQMGWPENGRYSGASISVVGREMRVPVKGVRKLTAQAMVASAFTAPHVTEWITVDATRTMKMVRRLKRDRDFAGVSVSPLLVVARAVCLAIRHTPEVNASWDEESQEIVLKHYVNLGIAAATPRGLLVPNIKDAEQLPIGRLAAQINELASLARAGKTPPADQAGGTFTITNVGVFGVDSGTPIINPGESAILCMGAIRRQAWVVGNVVKPRWITTLAVSFDHRIVDGAQGSKFLADVADIVRDPGSALLF